MKKETSIWLQFAQENFSSAELLLKNGLFNPCLQNVQQSIEKFIKAMLLENSVAVTKTHSIMELVQQLKIKKIILPLNEEEIELIDSIYLPSKYPLGSALPHFEPDAVICNKTNIIAKKVKDYVEGFLK